MQAENERRYDEYDKLATQAMWIRSAFHAKKLKKSDLFKRPNGNDDKPRDRKSLDEMRREVDEINAWLATLQVDERGE